MAAFGIASSHISRERIAALFSEALPVAAGRLEELPEICPGDVQAVHHTSPLLSAFGRAACPAKTAIANRAP